MAPPSPFEPDPDEALGLWTLPLPAPADHSDLRALRFEYSSRGDRVPGRLLLPPAGAGPFPLVLLQHGGDGSREAPYSDTTAGPWARAGVAIASIDLPLHGERADPKLAALAAGAAEASAPGGLEALAGEATRQAIVDLRRALDATAELPQVDATHSVYAGFGPGALLGAIFCGVDPRPRAAALALAGAGVGPPGADPAAYIAGAAGRPLLFIAATRDATTPRAATEALFAAAPEPKQLHWFDATHGELPGAALEEMWAFLKEHL